MAKSKQNESEEAITEDAIADLQAFWDIGKASLRDCPGRAKKADIEREAARRRLNPFTLRKARQFADEVNGYSEPELEKLWAQMRQPERLRRGENRRPGLLQRGKSKPSPVPFSRSHLILLLAVPTKKDRASLQKQGVKEKWTVVRMRAEMAKRYGRQRYGGKRPGLPDDLLGVYAQIESMCGHWRRWYADLTRWINDAKVPLLGVSEEIQQLLAKAKTSLTKLQAVVSGELAAEWPTREMKHSDLADISPERK